MKKHKHIVHLLLTISILFTMVAGFCTMNNTIVAKEKNFKTLTLKVISCNTYFYLDDSQDFSYDYDKTLFDVDVKDDDSNRCITISKKKGAKPTIDDKVLIYMPASLPFDNVRIKNKSAGMSLCEINKPITINANKASLVIPLPKDFSESLNVTAVSSAMVIKASKKTGINFSLKAKESAVALPKSYSKYYPTKKEYSYTYGDGAVDITSDITSCSFVLKLK
ncbi:hypothetical protein [Anaeromicropila herbilytica]|uniref:Uncharacterized protein n=1 Tax=Anaeromicropila herbilytica TaxID=2785025 RepID=A0A7R7ELJ4_9FIRM|nr:hypothetical protein [Anaeromicropila herbilytica]BCN31002.1 hypothetical protein bsdtb5_22970 [Anaeromicropila herbilytica]